PMNPDIVETLETKLFMPFESNEYEFIRLNLANGDMVGHTGNLNSSIIAAEVVDMCIGRIIPAVKESGGIAVITADHGNLEEMYIIDKKTGEIKIDKETGEKRKKTSHTLNPVPLIIYDSEFKNEYKLAHFKEQPGIANIASALLILLGFEPPEAYLPGVIEMVSK
ncbi:hypothetical protein ACFL20_07515, partial [Spirochaetota bacterium]